MSLTNVRVGVAVGGSHCNMDRAVDTMKRLRAAGALLTPVIDDRLDGVPFSNHHPYA